VGGSSGTPSGGTGGTGGAAGLGASGGSAGASAGGAAGQAASGGTGGQAGTGGSGGGTSGNAGSSGTGVGGGSSHPCDTALFCDDFESYLPGEAPDGPWAAREDAGTVAVDSEQKVSGNQSVKFTTDAGGGGAALIRLTDAAFPVPGNAFYGRMMYRLESAPTASVHWTILAGGGVVPNATHHALYRYGGQHPVMDGQSFVGSQLMANYETPDWYSNMNTPGSDCWQHANGDVLPTGAFVCVEWFFDGPNDEMRLWLDGNPIDSVTVTGSGQGCVNAANDFTWSAPEFETLDLGWEFYQQDAARTVWIDDLVISTTKVGCP
jgi:hypothetical protein